MTTMTRIRCGGCQGSHGTIAEVKSCCLGIGAAEPELGFTEEIRRRDAETKQAFQPTIPMSPADWYEHGLEIQRRERVEDEPVCTISKPVTTEGVYRNPQTGDIFKVYRTVHGANQLVAKQLVILDEADQYEKTYRGKQVTVKAEFVYRGKAGLRGLTASMQMSLEEAKKYGALYGVCVRCGLTLTKEGSIERAMGDICARKANWA